jgi:hypothetical protein
MLRMSEDEAYRRSKAARLVRQFPELFERIATGELHLTGLLLLGPHLDCERRREILDSARFRSKREIQSLVSRLDPKPAVPALVEPIGAEVRRQVWARDGARCGYVDDNARRCAETARLELHHLVPYANAGAHDSENIALRCELCRMRHNLHYAAYVFMPHRVARRQKTRQKLV